MASDEGRRVVHEVMTRQRAEIGAIVARMPAHRRAGLVEALTAVTDAGGEPRWSARDETPERARDRAEVD
ncbi:hypothetical protein [Lentzea guizhouensis]|uniref:hypothetical protein n=1 Tax=Lentzea guizhouensis TaxID=1586287 RepID=UPI001F3BB516|nr:hypothetical protein [Lentzea guizhouensis]